MYHFEYLQFFQIMYMRGFSQLSQEPATLLPGEVFPSFPS